MLNLDFKSALKRSKESVAVSLLNEKMLEEQGYTVFEDLIYSDTSFVVFGPAKNKEIDFCFVMPSLKSLSILSYGTFNLYYDKEEKELFFIWEDGQRNGIHIVREWSKDYYDDSSDEIIIDGEVYETVEEVPFIQDIEDTGVITEDIMNKLFKYTVSAKDILEKERKINK